MLKDHPPHLTKTLRIHVPSLNSILLIFIYYIPYFILPQSLLALILYTSNCKAVIAVVRVLDIGAGGCEQGGHVPLGEAFHLPAFLDLPSSFFIAGSRGFNFCLLE